MIPAPPDPAASGGLRRLAVAARDLFLPRCCAGCGEPGSWWCAACASRAEPDPVVLTPGLPVAAAVPYADPARRLVLAHKDRQVSALRPILAGLLLASLDRLGCPPGTALVPMPASARSRRARGFDPVLAITHAAAARARAEWQVVPALAWARQPLPQKRLDRTARLDNVRGRMRARRVARPVVVVDDVVTTGASLQEARRALVAAGTPVVGGAVVCYTR